VEQGQAHIQSLLSIALSETMSKPSEGTYVIVNRVLSSIGEELAITFNGKDQTATLTPRSNSEAQRVSFFPSFFIIIW
jgi:regulator of sigma D